VFVTLADLHHGVFVLFVFCWCGCRDGGRYPLDCVTLVRLCSALVADSATAVFTFSYLGGFLHLHDPSEPLRGGDSRCMLSFTHEQPDGRVMRVVHEGKGATRIVELTQPQLYPVEGVILPVGTRGRASKDGTVVSWRYAHSIWPVLMARLAGIAARAAAEGALAVGADAIAEAAASISLVGQLLGSWNDMAARLSEHLEVRLRRGSLWVVVGAVVGCFVLLLVVVVFGVWCLVFSFCFLALLACGVVGVVLRLVWSCFLVCVPAPACVCCDPVSCVCRSNGVANGSARLACTSGMVSLRTLVSLCATCPR